MYYEEKVINGILCHRSTPNGKWIEFTKEQLTRSLISLQEKLRKQEIYSDITTQHHLDNNN